MSNINAYVHVVEEDKFEIDGPYTDSDEKKYYFVKVVGKVSDTNIVLFEDQFRKFKSVVSDFTFI